MNGQNKRKHIDKDNPKRYTELVTSIIKGVKAMYKLNKNKEDATATWQNSKTVNVIIGVLLMFAVASIAYSSYVVWFGTTGTVPKLMLVPQMVLAAIFVTAKFTK